MNTLREERNQKKQNAAQNLNSEQSFRGVGGMQDMCAATQIVGQSAGPDLKKGVDGKADSQNLRDSAVMELSLSVL